MSEDKLWSCIVPVTPPNHIVCDGILACAQVYSARASRDRGKAQATKHISFAPETQDIGKPIPAVYGGSPAEQRQRPPPHVMDYTVKAGIRPTSPVRIPAMQSMGLGS